MIVIPIQYLHIAHQLLTIISSEQLPGLHSDSYAGYSNRAPVW